ncbi:hypothetical protein ACFROC_00505 [Nocardia tengchongensis]|uniref:hypothetical protein n=1 Tax=Nocardia tengchongensis TaxID=2055889 RepID=UPI00369AD770
MNSAVTEQDSSHEQSRGPVAALLAAAFAASGPGLVRGALDQAAVLARTLLARVLSVVDDSLLAPGWAVAVLRRGDGLAAVVTSTEGRCWLPSGLYLPRTVTTPWSWATAHDTGWEGLTDPARILVEFALARERVVGDQLVALASSGPIAPYLRSALPQVSMDGDVAASGDRTFAAAGPGLLDRLELTCAPRLVARVQAVAPARVGPTLDTLARDAHTRLVRAGLSEVPGLFDVPVLRDRILTAHRDRVGVPPTYCDDLRDADDLLAVTLASLRVDAASIPLGDLRSGPRDRGMGQLYALTLQRRANELVLLSEAESSVQSLRDATYAHTLLAEHPWLSHTVAGGPVATG